jgi:hypothetical protein
VSGILETRLQRLVDERDTVSRLHGDLLAHVESREGSQGLTEIEEGQIAGYRARSGELDSEISSLMEDMEREAASAKASKLARAHISGVNAGVDVGGSGEVTYRTFAAYARDVLLARTGGGEAFESIRTLAGGSDVVAQARERLARTPANTLSADVAGLIPDQHVAQIFQVIDDSRGLVQSAQKTDLVRGKIQYPKLTQRPLVAVQASEKTEAGNQKMIVAMEETTASTYLGGGDLSWQSIEWSTPNALDLWFRACAAHYALMTETDAGNVVTDDAFTNGISSKLGATATFAEVMTAIGAGAEAVYAATGRMADTVYMAPDRYWYLFGLTSAAFAQFATVTPNGVGPFKFVPTRGFSAGEIVVGDSQGLLVAETAGAPVQLKAVEPAIGGLEVGLIGAFEAVVVDTGSFSLITTAS